MNKMNRLSRIILYFYGLGWLLGGLVFAYAGMIAPAIASQFIQEIQPGWSYYVIAFAIFTMADTAMMLIGLVFRRILGINGHTDTAAFCLFAGGFIGVFVDLRK